MQDKKNESAIERLKNQLVYYKHHFEVEKNIKNNLYFFILDQGLFAELRKFEGATNMRSPKGHSRAVTALTNHFINNTQKT